MKTGKSTHPKSSLLLKSVCSFLVSSLLLQTAATAAATPEQQSANIARSLRGIPDQEWGQIAGERITDKYEVSKGDTLYHISGRLFGDTKYWPKIWELNNPRVLNPHFIYPRNTLTFQSGSGSSLPGLYVGDVAERTGTNDYVLRNEPAASSSANLLSEGPGPRWDEKTPKPRAEWQKLGKQPWESIDIQLPPDVDKNGFDSKSYVNRGRTLGDELPYLMTCEKVEPAGYIDGNRNINRMITMGDEITIRPNISELTPNATYFTLGTPLALTNVDRRAKRREVKDAREALAYPVTGKVKVIGVNDGVYVANVINHSEPLSRGDVLHAQIPRVRITENVNGPSAVQGHVYVDPSSSTYLTAQHKWVFIDRGTNEGVKRGMIFRIFQYKDPLTSRNLTNTETLVQGDAQVYASCGTYSLAKVLWSRDAIDSGTAAILLTDVSEYYSRYYLNGKVMPSDLNPPLPDAKPTPVSPDETSPDPLTDAAEMLPPEELGSDVQTEPAKPEDPEKPDWLDQLDQGDDLSSDEAKELQQLEKYEDSTPETAPLESEPAPPAEQPAIEPAPSGAPPTGDLSIDGETMLAPPEEAPPVISTEGLTIEDPNNPTLKPKAKKNAEAPKIAPIEEPVEDDSVNL